MKKVIMILISMVLVTACSSVDKKFENNKVEEKLEENQYTSSGYPIIDKLVIEEINKENIKETRTDTVYEEKDLLAIKVLNDNVIVLLRNASETSDIMYKYSNGTLVKGGGGSSDNNSDIVRVSIGINSSHIVKSHEIISFAEVIINDEKLISKSHMVELYFKNGIITKEIVTGKGIIIPLIIGRDIIDEKLLLQENADELEEYMSKYSVDFDYLLLKDINNKVIFDSRSRKDNFY